MGSVKLFWISLCQTKQDKTLYCDLCLSHVWVIFLSKFFCLLHRYYFGWPIQMAGIKALDAALGNQIVYEFLIKIWIRKWLLSKSFGGNSGYGFLLVCTFMTFKPGVCGEQFLVWNQTWTGVENKEWNGIWVRTNPWWKILFLKNLSLWHIWIIPVSSLLLYSQILILIILDGWYHTVWILRIYYLKELQCIWNVIIRVYTGTCFVLWYSILRIFSHLFNIYCVKVWQLSSACILKLYYN